MLTAGSDKSPVTATLKWQPFFLLQHIVVIVMLNQPFIKFQSASAPHWITSRDLLHRSRLRGGCLPPWPHGARRSPFWLRGGCHSAIRLWLGFRASPQLYGDRSTSLPEGGCCITHGCDGEVSAYFWPYSVGCSMHLGEPAIILLQT